MIYASALFHYFDKVESEPTASNTVAKALEQEVQVQIGIDDMVCILGQQLTQAKHPSKNDIQSRLNSLQEKRRLLDSLIKERRQRLEDAAESYQCTADANEAESWMKENGALVLTDDYGKDLPTARQESDEAGETERSLPSTPVDVACAGPYADTSVKQHISESPEEVNLNNNNETKAEREKRERTENAIVEQYKYALIPPPFWSSLNFDLSTRLIDFPPNSEGWASALAYLKPFKIPDAIFERVRSIQNLPMWQHYSLDKMHMYWKNGADVENERIAFHGCPPDAAESIVNTNFNRCFSFKKDCTYGCGVNFAKEPGNAMRSKYAMLDVKPNKNRQNIFICAILTGVLCKGSVEMKAPLPLPDGSGLCDCSVDNVKKPTIFCLYRDVQVYPLWWLTYIKTKHLEK